MTTASSSSIRYPKRRAKPTARRRRKGSIVGYCALAVTAFFVLNWIYQVTRKPAELFAPVSSSLAKTHEATWRSYGAIFEQHSTNIISPEFLAALAQVEASGNPVARPDWRWQWSWNPLELYRPASSALGMFQITDGTFAAASKFCIRDHEVVADGTWHDPRSCWFNRFYSRILPSHATEMTAAYLHYNVIQVLAARRITNATLAQKQRLAAVIHLCGVKRGEAFVQRGFRVSAGERCGAHSTRGYLARVEQARQKFVRLRKAVVDASLDANRP